MVLSPNDEEVANSSKKNIPNPRLECTNDTLFQTKTSKKPYPLAHTYIAHTSDYPHGAKNALQIMNLAAYASETNKEGVMAMSSPCNITIS